MKVDTAWFVPRALDCLLLSYALVLAAQFARLPLWLLAIAVVAGGLGWLIRRRGWRPLPKWALFAVTIITVAAFWLAYRGQFTVDTAASFFVLTVALKWLELRQRRDLYILFFILCYLVIVTLLFRDSILWTGVLLVAIFLVFNGLQLSSAGRVRRLSLQTWRRTGWLFAKAIPVVIILFVFFPRMGPLWSVPLVSDQATTGLSDEMSPGEISDLVQNSERAFRVEFGGETPRPGERYWRALILDDFDGRTWRRRDQELEERASRVNTEAQAGSLAENEYEVLMEPSYQRWGYALADSVPVSPNLTQDFRGLVRFERSVDTRLRYRMMFQQDPPQTSLSDRARRQYTQLPADSNPQTRAWVAEQQARTDDDEALINALMQHFNAEPYYYTLRPPRLGDQPVDELLFDTYRGFCEHYASALTFMLRAADIPARVVTGYLGGESGLNDGYLIVRQYDAHAWVEAWMPDYGWVRLDPTAMIAPDRIELGLRESMRDEGSFLENNWASPDRYQDFALVNWMRLRADAMNYYWQRWVVGYQGQTQLSLFERLPGAPGMRELGLITAGLVAILIGLSAGYALWLHRRRRFQTPYQRLYGRWLRWLQKQQLPTGPGDPPTRQAMVAAEALPAQENLIKAFGKGLNRLFYAPGDMNTDAAQRDLERMRRQLRQIRRLRPVSTRDRPGTPENRDQKRQPHHE